MDLETYSDDEGVVLKRRSVKLTLIDSDDDDDALPGSKTATTFVGGAAADSSSEEDDDSGKENSSLKANRVKSKRRVVARDSDSDSDSEELLNFKTRDADDGEGPKKPAATLFKDKDLYDDETSDHEEVERKKSAAAGRGEESSGEDCSDSEGSNEDFGDLEPGGDEDQEEAKKKTATKPSRKLESRKAKTAAMEGIELIHSETQRLLRESRLSLPYHRPKQHTIAEFLQRRSVRATAQERNANSQDLGLIWKELEERTKEAEAFYKSDTEDSDDGDAAEEGGEKQPPSSQDTVAGEPGSAPDALKDSGILSTTSSFTGEASSPVEGDPTPSEGKGAGGSPCPEGPEDPSANQNGESQKVPDTICEEDNKAEDPSSEQGDRNSPELFRQQLEVPRDEESKAQETSPDLFLTQTQGTRDSEEKAAAPEVEGEEVCKATPRSAAAILLSRLGNVKPRLSCGEGEVVDLTDDGDSTTTPGRRGGVEELISRFMKHAGSKPATPKEKPQVGVSVVSVEKDADGLEQVKNDTVFVALEEVASAVDPALSKPGARLKRLKEELNKKIAKQREEEWAKRQLEFKMDEEEIDDEKSVCGLLDDEREAELSESETEEEEEEEDDVPIMEKKRTKSAFLDDEAEVSEDGEDGGAVSGGEDEAEEEDGGGGGDDNVDGGDESEEAESDDDDTEEEEDTTPLEDAGKKPKLRRIKTFDMFETDEEKSGDEGEEDVGNVSTVSALNIPPYQPGGALTQPPKAEPGSITPLLKVPVLKGVISEPNLQNLNESSLMSPCDPPTQPAATDGVDVNQAKKKLFNQSEFSTQENMAELMDVCSGTFSGKMMASELMGLCSGNFSTQPVNLENLEKDDEKVLAPAPPSYPLDDLEDTQPMGSASDSFSTGPAASSAPQLLHGGQSLGDERRQGLLSGNEDSNAQFPDQTPNTPPGLRLRILSSDEEAEEENMLQKNKKKGKKRKKKNMQLQISDDEDEEDGEASDRSIGYDSEENEIDPEEAVLRRKTKATEFFEDEAELSESEWGSADEDEQDLDKLEWEEGDAEKLNEKKVREQLEKIHMRRVLDDDQREVRILQELLLEDGEFHSDGPGRERKFRWRNINITQVEQEPRGSDDENPEEGDEEENELEWRKKRLERETFFMEQKEKAAAAGKDLDEEDDLLADEGDSQLLQLGKAALKRMRSFNSDQGPRGEKRGAAATDPQVSPNPKYPFRLLTKRGSFLSRSEVALARIAHITRGAGAAVLNGPKHSRNFVFAAISPEKVLDPPEERAEDLKTATAAASSKRKSSSSATLLQKKPRLSTGKGLFDHLEL